MNVSATEKQERTLFVAAFLDLFPLSETAAQRTAWRAIRTRLSDAARSRLIAAMVEASPYAQRVKVRALKEKVT